MAQETKITLPPGMTKEEFEKLFTTFQKTRVNTKAHDKAVREATKKLVAAHKPEYDGYLKALLPKGE